MALSTKQVTTFKQQFDRIQRPTSYGKAWRRWVGMNSSAGSTTRDSQRRASAVLSGHVRSCWRGKSGPAAGWAVFTVPTRHQAAGNRPS